MLRVSFFFSSRRRHTRCYRDWSSDVCSSDLRRGPRTTARSRPSDGPPVLAVHGADVERFGLLRRMRMIGPGVDAQVSQLLAGERPARQHPLDRILDDALGKLPLDDRLRGAFLDAADIAGVVVIDLL